MLKVRPLFKITLSLLGVLVLLGIIISSQPMRSSQAAGGCQVVYTPNQWNTGFTANVKVINNNTTAINGWTLTWSFADGQQITGSWNATVTQSGANVTASAPAGHWNGTIGANGGSVSFGFLATHTGVNTIPTDFALNGVACNGNDVATSTPTPTTQPTNTPTPTPACTTHTASVGLSTSSTTVKVGDTITVAVTLNNEGCADLGLPKYYLYIQPEGTDPIFTPASPTPVVHYLGIGSGQSDTEEFDLLAVAAGQATLTARVSFEVHIGYPGPAYWSAANASPLVITVEP